MTAEQAAMPLVPELTDDDREWLDDRRRTIIAGQGERETIVGRDAILSLRHDREEPIQHGLGHQDNRLRRCRKYEHGQFCERRDGLRSSVQCRRYDCQSSGASDVLIATADKLQSAESSGCRPVCQLGVDSAIERPLSVILLDVHFWPVPDNDAMRSRVGTPAGGC